MLPDVPIVEDDEGSSVDSGHSQDEAEDQASTGVPEPEDDAESAGVRKGNGDAQSTGVPDDEVYNQEDEEQLDGSRYPTRPRRPPSRQMDDQYQFFV